MVSVQQLFALGELIICVFLKITAAKENNLDLVKSLVEIGVNPDAREKDDVSIIIQYSYLAKLFL